MYSNNKSTSSFDNTITVTPIKVEVNMSHSYPPSSSSSVAVAATTSARRPSNPPNPQGLTANTAALFPTSSSTGATPKDKPTKSPRAPIARKPPPTLDTFWPTIMTEVRSIQQVDAKHQALPLARIKKIMKLDENAKMIAAEAPLLFAKACEYFIQELTMRAWIHTEESKRRTLQRSDIAQAIANYDQFDFLIDIVPREDIKPSPSTNQKKEAQSPAGPAQSATSMGTSSNMAASAKAEQQTDTISFSTLTPENQQQQAQGAPQHQQQQQQQLQIIQHPQQQLQYFITIPGQQQQAGGQQLVQQLQLQQQQLPNGLAPQLAGFNLVAQQPQQLILTQGPNGQLTATPAPQSAVQQQQQQTAMLQNLAQQQQQQQQQQIQLLQQVVTPNGELTNVPITINANQLNLLRLQMQQQQQQQQQVIIPTQCLTAQQLLQLGQVAANNNASAATQAAVHLQQQQHQHQQHNSGANIYLNAPQAAQAVAQPVHSSGSIGAPLSSDRNTYAALTVQHAKAPDSCKFTTHFK